jgi:hypothetical protein
MEYTATCHAIRQIELLPKLLVKNDMAEIVKSKESPDGKVRSRKYCIFVGDELEVNVRFWYDERYDKACFKLSDQGIEAILQSGTVMSGMVKLGKNISKNGNGFNMVDLVDLMGTTLKKLEEEKILKDDL